MKCPQQQEKPTEEPETTWEKVKKSVKKHKTEYGIIGVAVVVVVAVALAPETGGASLGGLALAFRVFSGSLTVSQLTRSEYSAVFRLLDDFSRSKHNCCLTELFPNEARVEYVLCFRPVTISKESPDPMMSYRYLYFSVIDMRVAVASQALPVPMVEKLDQALQGLS